MKLKQNMYSVFNNLLMRLKSGGDFFPAKMYG